MGQSEVRNPEIAPHIDQQIGRLDIAVHHTQLVRVLQRLGCLQSPIGNRAEE